MVVTADVARALKSIDLDDRPKHEWISAGLGELITSGWIRPAERLPTDRELAQVLGVSRTTVVRAYNDLKSSGLLDRTVGSGTYVRHRRREHDTRMVDLVEPQRKTQDDPQLTSTGHSMINLSNSVPAPLPELAEAIRAVADEVYTLSGSATHHTQGDPALRRWVADWYSGRGLATDPNQVVITSGAQQALTMSCQLLLRKGAYLVVERPTYLGILDIARNRNAHLLSVPELGEPASLEPLTEALGRQGTAVLYTMSTCHTITGAVLGNQRKQEIRTLAQQTGSFIIDDDIFANQVFDAPISAPIAAYDSDSQVITIGGTSKLLWDGLRVGWIRAPRAMIGALIRIKSAADLETSVLAQLVSLRLLRDEALFARRRVAESRVKLAETCSLLADRLPDWQLVAPHGGRSMWIRLPAGTNAAAFASAAIEHGVAIAGGNTFTADGSYGDHLRLGFVHRDDLLTEGLNRLANAWSSHFQS